MPMEFIYEAAAYAAGAVTILGEKRDKGTPALRQFGGESEGKSWVDLSYPNGEVLRVTVERG